MEPRPDPNNAARVIAAQHRTNSPRRNGATRSPTGALFGPTIGADSWRNTPEAQWLSGELVMMPFDAYPHRGRRPIGLKNGENCRHEYGLRLQRLTRLNVCAYCGLSLIDTYDHWLKMSVDPVIPSNVGNAIGLPTDWLDDYCNMVLCCSACSEFGKRHEPKADPTAPATFEVFLAQRDSIFTERKTLILRCHEKELAFYDQQPWA
jgi:hypothetical protein